MTAIYLNLRNRRRVELLERLSDFFDAFACFSELSPKDAVHTAGRLAKTERFAVLGFLAPFSANGENADVKEVWCAETGAFGGSAVLTPEQRERLASFSEHFGMTSLSLFVGACRKYEAYFAEERRKEKQRLEKKGTLTISAGLLAAALILIVCW